jgi:hypothetical protein
MRVVSNAGARAKFRHAWQRGSDAEVLHANKKHPHKYKRKKDKQNRKERFGAFLFAGFN